jgi:hypothetical protein
MAPICTYVSKENAVSCDLNGEAVILNVNSGKYFALDPIGTEVWRCLGTPATVSTVCETLMLSYDVPSDRCLADVSDLITKLYEHGLIERHSESTLAPDNRGL